MSEHSYQLEYFGNYVQIICADKSAVSGTKFFSKQHSQVITACHVLNQETKRLHDEIQYLRKAYAAIQRTVLSQEANLQEWRDDLHIGASTEKRFAELEAEILRLRIANMRLGSLVTESCVIDEATGDVYENGELNPDLFATLEAYTILSTEPEPTTADDANDESENE